MAVQKHILILHNRKRQNANAIWIMILGYFSLCSFTTLCLLFNDWTLLPQAYNPKPLILGEALFDLNPDLFPFHRQQENGKWEKLINEAKNQTNHLVKRFNDWIIVQDVLSDQEEQGMSKDRSRSATKSLINAGAKGDHDSIPVSMRKRSTNEDARPSFRIKKSFSVGSGERKEAKAVKERNKLLHPLSTQSQPSSPTSVESMEVDFVPVKSILKTKSGLKKRVRAKDRVQFAKNEKVRFIRDRVSPERNILYNTEGGQMRTSNDINGKEKEDDRLVKRSGGGLPPLAPLNRENSSQSLSNYESEWKGDPDRHLHSSSKRRSRSPSPASSPESSSRRTASYNDVQSFLRPESGSGGEIDWLAEADRHSRTSTRRKARTPSPTPLQRIRTTERLSPSHSVSPFHLKEQSNTQRRRHSFGTVDRELDKLGELSIVQSFAGKSSLRPKDSPRARRVSFEGTDDYRNLHTSNSPRILSTRHSGRSEGLLDALHISSPDKGNLQKRDLYHDQEMKKRCTDCLSFFKPKSKKGNEDMLPLRSNSEHKKSRLSTSSSISSQAKVQIVSPQRQTFSSYSQKQAPLKSNDDLRKYAIVKNAASTVKVMKRSFSADEGNDHLPPSPPEKQSWEYPIPNKSILKPKDRTRNQISELRHVTFAEGTKLESSNKPRSSFRRKKVSKVFYDAQRPSNIERKVPLYKSFQVTSMNESNRNTGTRRPYVSSMARYTSKQQRNHTSILARRSSPTKTRSSDSDDESFSIDSGSTLSKRAISENGSSTSIPIKSSLRSATKPKNSNRVSFGGISKIEIPARELGSPGSPRSPVKEVHDMFAVKPTVLFDASKQPQHQTSSSKLERIPSIKPGQSTTSTITHDTTTTSVTTPSSTPGTTSSRSSTFSSYSRSGSKLANSRERFFIPSRGYNLSKYSQRNHMKKRNLMEKRSGFLNPGSRPTYPRDRLSGPSKGYNLLNTGFKSRYSKRSLVEKRGEVGYNKRDLIEKRARKRKANPMSHVSSSESFIHTADHIAQYGVTPLKKSKQKQQSQKTTSATTSDLSPSGLGFSGLHIKSKNTFPTESNYSKGSMSTSRDRLSRSDSLRSTGSSSFRGSLDDHSSSLTRPGSPSSQRGQWWSGYSDSSSGGGVPFVY